MLKLMRPLFAPLLVCAAISLTACATMPAQGLRGGQSPTAPERHLTAYGEFLAGATASREGRDSEASVYFERGAALGTESALLNQRAFDTALIAGEVARAAMLAPRLDGASPPVQGLGRLTRAVDALADRRPREALRLITSEPVPPPHRIGALLLTPWIAAEAGDWKVALALPDSKGDHLIDSIAKLNQALLLEAHGDIAPADILYRKLLSDGDESGVFAGAYGRFLERTGRRADALAIYNAGLKGDANNAVLRQDRDRADSTASPPPRPTLTEGAARALMEPAEIYLSESRLNLA